MRLLNVASFRLEEFIGEKRPRYAILSHTWGDEEVLFQDIQNHECSMWKQKRGFKKVEDSCRRAKLDRYEYIWIDTCCIDKSSSAELSEAINSMFAWYESSCVCYAFIEDIQDPADLPKSRWFTRGWTLQELIAPHDVRFYSKSWELLGDRYTLSSQIAERTGINIPVLTLNRIVNNAPREQHTGWHSGCIGCGDRVRYTSNIVKNYCVAQKMNWASSRQTTRAEDMAYCLLGIFGIHMTLIYGEGLEGAFRRLQEEILKRSDDHSILAWRDDSPDYSSVENEDILATTLLQFRLGNDYVQSMQLPYGQPNRKLQMESNGLFLTAILCPAPPEWRRHPDNETWTLAVLDCVMGNDLSSRPALLLMKFPNDENMFYRIHPKFVCIIEPSGDLRVISSDGSEKIEYFDNPILENPSTEKIHILPKRYYPTHISGSEPLRPSRISQFNQNNMDGFQYRIVDSVPQWTDSQHRTLPGEYSHMVAFENESSAFFLLWNNVRELEYAIVSLVDMIRHLEDYPKYYPGSPPFNYTVADIMAIRKMIGHVDFEKSFSTLVTNRPLIIYGPDSHRFEVSANIKCTSFLGSNVIEVEVNIKGL
ncbi:HET-domain-containing protein [Daldinia decipiens]|uniref:HET-domain-containing protein n=1 Tax=Daldinia decipiens TaxID=326647 RepID=UPI0020C34998|nr:HET-domain-containing protein [Daldinia decipiens]KAI1653546.1 HET-domain-containing protein [Daldinia decipiens]